MKKLLSREIPPGAAVVVIVLMVAASVVTGRNAAEAPAGVVEPVARTAPTEPPSRGVESDLPLERLQRAKREGEPMDLFAPPAPPVAAIVKPAPPPPPPPPSAPPLPYRFLGRMVDGEAVTVFLAKGDDAVSARVGDTLDGVWRLDAVGPTSISMTYLPLNLPQPLAIPAQ